MNEPSAQLDLVDTSTLARAGVALSVGVAERVRNSRSPNTVRAYEGDVTRWAAWCKANGRRALPADRETFAEYISHLCDGGKAPATIQRAMAAIRKLHEEAGHEGEPHPKLARDVLLGYKRQRATDGKGRVKKATPISQDSLRRMVETCDLATVGGCRDHLLLTLGMGLMGRRSELVGLNLDDVVETDRGILVYIALSKTDKSGEGEEVAIENGTYEGTDPVRALRMWREILGSRGITSGRLLRSVGKGGRLGRSLSADAVNDVVKDRARRAGLSNPDSYSAHSLRAGGLTASLREGTPLGVAAAHGRWKPTSPVVNGYARTEDRWRDNAMRGVL